MSFFGGFGGEPEPEPEPVKEEPPAEETTAAEDTSGGALETEKGKGGDAHGNHKIPEHLQHVPFKGRCIHFPDFIFGGLFLGMFATVSWLAIEYGIIKLFTYSGSLCEDGGYDDKICSDDAIYEQLDSKTGYYQIFYVFAYTAAFSVICAIIWLWFITEAARYVIKFICLVAFVGLFGGCIALVQSGYTAAQYILMPMAALVILYYALNHDRIEFAGVTLELACKVIRDYPSVVLVKILVVVLQLAWCLLIALAAVGLYVDIQTNYPNANTSETTKMWLLLVCAFFWGQQFLDGVVVCMMATVTAEWWFEEKKPHHPALKALRWALTYSFGSIAFGSLLVAIIETAEAYITYLQRNASGVMKKILKLLACIVHCIRKCAEYLTAYAYVFIGIHGYGLPYAGYKVFQLFAHFGVSVVQNDALVSAVLFMANISLGIVAGGFGVLLVEHGPDSWSKGVPDAEYLAALMGFLIGYSICAIFLGAIKGANKTVFVCWLENPHALEKTHADYHDLMKKSAHKIGIEEREHDLNEDDGTKKKKCCNCCC